MDEREFVKANKSLESFCLDAKTSASTMPSDEVYICKNYRFKENLVFVQTRYNKFQFLKNGMNRNLVVEDVETRDTYKKFE